MIFHQQTFLFGTYLRSRFLSTVASALAILVCCGGATATGWAATTIFEHNAGRILIDSNGDGLGNTVGSAAGVARVGEVDTDVNQGRYFMPFVLTEADRQAIAAGRRVNLRISYGAAGNVANVAVPGGGPVDLRVDIFGFRGRTSAVPFAADYQATDGDLLHAGAITPQMSPGGYRSFDVTDFVQEESAAGNVVIFRLQIDPPSVLPNSDTLANRYSFHTHADATRKPHLEIQSGPPIAMEGRVLVDNNGDGQGNTIAAPHRLNWVGEVNTDADQGRMFIPFKLNSADRQKIAAGSEVSLKVSLGTSSSVTNVQSAAGGTVDLQVDLLGYLDRTAESPVPADYHNPGVVLLRTGAATPQTPTGYLTFDVTNFVRDQAATGNVVAFRLQVDPATAVPNSDEVPNRYIFHSYLESDREPFLEIQEPPETPDDRLLGTDGFRNVDYASSIVRGANPIIAGFDGPWIGTTASAVQLAGTSLLYPGYTTSPGGAHVTAGNRRFSVNANTALSRRFLTGNNGPLGNFVNADRVISNSRNGHSLYLSFLMRVTSTGTTPTEGAFSLYNGVASSENEQFRIAYSGDRMVAVAGPSGTPVDMGARSAATRLVVVKIGFGPGDDRIDVWLDPEIDGAQPTPDATLYYDLSFDRMGLTFERPAGTDSAGELELDEFRIAADWAVLLDPQSVVDYPAPVPAPPQSEWGMAGFPPSLRADGLYPEGFFPFIDRFGQYRHQDWEDKVYSVADLVARTQAEAQELAAYQPPGRSRFGGWSQGPRLFGTGFFRTAKYNGDWWLVDPDGYLFFSNGITTVGSVVRTETGALSSQKTGITGRERFFADFPASGEMAHALGLFGEETATVTSGFYHGTRPLAQNFFATNALLQFPEATSVGALREITGQLALDRLRSWGFNTVAGWSDFLYNIHPDRLPYTPVLFPANPPGIGSSGNLFPDYFRDVYATNVRNRLLQEADGSLGDPWNIGYFINNEPDWAKSNVADIDVGLVTLQSPRLQLANYAKQAFVELMQQRYPNIDALNAQWLSNYASWNAMLDRTDLSFNVGRATADLVAFSRAYAEQYFRTNRDAIREVAPQHLYLGTRFTSGVILRPEMSRAAILYCDVYSMNRYATTVGVFEGMEGDVPMMVTEYATWTTDTGLFGNTQGPQRSEAARPGTFGDQLHSAIVHPRHVGAHWFQYFDFPPSGRLTGVNNNSNYGFVQVTNVPYSAMVDEARSLGYPMYELRAGVTPGGPVADAYVADGSAADQNFGEAPELLVGTGGTGMNRIAYLRFATTGAVGPVDRAILTLYPTETAGDPRHTVTEVPDASWAETGITWMNRPAASGGGLATWSPVAGQPVDLDVTDAYNAAVADQRPLSVRIEARGGSGFAAYGSREGALADRPQLRVVSGADDLETWRRQYFPVGAPEGDDSADPSGDGVTNLMKYAFGLNPVVPTVRGLPQVGRDGEAFSVTFNRARSDIVYTVETSLDLVTWAELAVDPGEVGRNVTVTFGPEPSERSRFFRVRVRER